MDNSVLFQLIPIGTFWAAANVLLMAAKRVNEIRDTVLLCKIKDEKITAEHMKIMRLDYRLVAGAAVVASWASAVILFWGAFNLPGGGWLGVLWFVLALAMVWFGVGFIWCGVYDLRAMRTRIEEATKAESSQAKAGEG